MPLYLRNYLLSGEARCVKLCKILKLLHILIMESNTEYVINHPKRGTIKMTWHHSLIDTLHGFVIPL